MMIIDPPVTPFSTAQELSDWLDELSTLPQGEPEVIDAIEQARRWLGWTTPEPRTPNPEP